MPDTTPKEKPWHALDPEAVAASLRAPRLGLTPAEAQQRLARHGPNRLPPPPPTPALAIALRQFRSPLIYLLLAAAGLALALGERADALFIQAVLLINAALGFAQELRADRSMAALARLVRSRARVRRGGHVVEVDSEEVVPGDFLLLEPGLRVPADVRLTETVGLRVDESVLTGESTPVEKHATPALPEDAPLADRRNLAFAGTTVISGRGAGLVVATGPATEVGRIAGQLGTIRRDPPPLIRRLERFARVIGIAVGGLALLLIALGLARGSELREIVLGAIALAVSAVPEGLPIALTVALAVAVSRMVRRRVVVRQLPAVEALGSCTVIATDKTGTLTKNELTAERVIAGRTRFRATGVGYEPQGEVLAGERPAVAAEHPALHRLLRAACLAGEATLVAREEGGFAWSGDPTDVALLSLAMKAGLEPESVAEAHPLVARIPFEPERRYAASYHTDGSGALLCVKGAPERVLDLCREEIRSDGTPTPLDRAAALRATEELMEAGYRVLAVADGYLPEPLPPGAVPPEPTGLTFLGLVAMTDPPREAVPSALARCRTAGIRVVMVTGDHAATARAVAARIGLPAAPEQVITGPELAHLDDEDLDRRLVGVAVVARATPEDKLRVVRSLRRAGELVAVTGDGVNDGPALRQADIGVAMGGSGTDVAREAADVVVTDDDFSSIVAGIEEGRIAYDNVRKVTYLLVSTGLGEVILVVAAVALGLPIPLTAAQLLWLNLVTNGIQDVALAFEPGEPGVMERAPRPPRERIFDRLMVERTLLAGSVFGVIGLGVWWQAVGAGLPIEAARNQMLQLFVLFEVFHIGNCRSERITLFRLSPLRNPVLLGGTLLALAVHIAALYAPAFQQLLSMAPLPAGEWLRLAALALAIVVVMEAHKALRGHGLRPGPPARALTPGTAA